MNEEVFYHSPEFWVAVTFISFVLLAFKPIWRFAATALDQRSMEIARQLQEAKKLQDEAAEFHRQFQLRQKQALEEAKHILDQAKQDADRLIQAKMAETTFVLQKRLDLAERNIAHTGQQALHAISRSLTDIALKAAEILLDGQIGQEDQHQLLAQAIESMKRPPR
jgi:F-type H+-transporting ATPase subunit b